MSERRRVVYIVLAVVGVLGLVVVPRMIYSHFTTVIGGCGAIEPCSVRVSARDVSGSPIPGVAIDIIDPATDGPWGRIGNYPGRLGSLTTDSSGQATFVLEEFETMGGTITTPPWGKPTVSRRGQTPLLRVSFRGQTLATLLLAMEEVDLQLTLPSYLTPQ